jgi:hypothetical protein
MKKIVLLSSLLIIMSAASAQVRIGLRVSPYLNLISVKNTNDTLNIKGANTGVRYSIGPVLDAYFGDNYAFSTGIWFATRKFGVNVDRTESVVNLQYIQIPVTLKLFTNEVADDLKLYFQLGGTADIKIAGRVVDARPGEKDNTRDLNGSLYFAVGGEYQMGTNTALFAGFNYNRGLINMFADKKSREFLNGNVNLVGLEFGIRF